MLITVLFSDLFFFMILFLIFAPANIQINIFFAHLNLKAM